MAYGFYSRNGANIVQIDQDFSNLAIESNAIHPITNMFAIQNQQLGSFKQFLISPPHGSYLFSESGSLNGEFAMNAVTKNRQGHYLNHNAGLYRPAYEFLPSGASHGLRIRRVDNSIAFDSGYFYIYPALTVNMPRTNQVVNVYLPPLTAGLNWAIPSAYMCYQFFAPNPHPQPGIGTIVLVFHLVNNYLLQMWYARMQTPWDLWHESAGLAVPNNMSITIFEV